MGTDLVGRRGPSPWAAETLSADTPDDETSGPPQRVGRYALFEPIGRGASATVYRARDPDLDRDVAVKLVERWRGLGGTQREAAARVIREAQAVAALNHPNIVPIFDVGRFDAPRGEGVFLAMEFLGGHSLRGWLRERPRAEAEVLEVFDQAARGLCAAHSAGVVHRDFKLSNAMIDARGRVRLIDFGLARAIGDAPSTSAEHSERPVVLSDLQVSLTTTGTVMGTPAYMSPEQHQGLPVGPQSDQFSFCVALFEALTGQRPHHGDTLRDLAIAKQTEALVGVEALPARLQAILRRGLAGDPERRWPNMEALRLALSPPARRRRTVVLAVGALLVGGIAIAATRPAPAQVPQTEVVSEQTPPDLAISRELRLLRETGSYAAARELGARALHEHRDDPARHASIAAEHAETLERDGAPTEAAQLRETAYHEATAVGAHAVAFDLAVALTHHAFDRQPSDVRQWSGQAEAAMERGQLGPLSQAKLLGLRAQRAEDAYDLEEAARLLAEALALLEGIDAIDVEERLLLQRAQLLARQGYFAGHLETLELAADRVAAEYGPDHPRWAQALSRLGAMATFLEEDALSHHAATRSIEIVERTVPSRHLVQAQVWADYALALAEWGQLEASLDAFATAEDALDAMDAVVDRDLALAAVWSNHGLTLNQMGENEAALGYLRRAKDAHVRLLGPEHLHVTTNGNNIAMLLRELGRLEEAETEARAVAAAFERSPGDPSMRAFTYQQLAIMMLDTDRHAEALPWAQRAIEVWDRVAQDHPESAIACFLAAQAVLPSDREAAQRYVNMALQRIDAPEGAAVLRGWSEDNGLETRQAGRPPL